MCPRCGGRDIKDEGDFAKDVRWKECRTCGLGFGANLAGMTGDEWLYSRSDQGVES